MRIAANMQNHAKLKIKIPKALPFRVLKRCAPRDSIVPPHRMKVTEPGYGIRSLFSSWRGVVDI